MYGSDLWAGGNRKHGHVGNQMAVYGEKAGSQQICICKMYFCRENNNKTSDAVFILHHFGHLSVSVEEHRGGWKTCNMIGFVPFMGCTVQIRSRWHVGGSGWRRRETICGQTLVNAQGAAYICNIHICISVDQQWEEGILPWHQCKTAEAEDMDVKVSYVLLTWQKISATKTRWALITLDLEL